MAKGKTSTSVSNTSATEYLSQMLELMDDLHNAIQQDRQTLSVYPKPDPAKPARSTRYNSETGECEWLVPPEGRDRYKMASDMQNERVRQWPYETIEQLECNARRAILSLPNRPEGYVAALTQWRCTMDNWHNIGLDNRNGIAEAQSKIVLDKKLKSLIEDVGTVESNYIAHDMSNRVVGDKAATKGKPKIIRKRGRPLKTEPTDSQTKIIAALTQYHVYPDGPYTDEPLSARKLAKLSNVSPTTATKFFDSELIGGQGKYETYCQSIEKLKFFLRRINGELSQEMVEIAIENFAAAEQ
jgi:hypothetical protein